MTHANDRKNRRKKRKRWQQRGGGGMVHTPHGTPKGGGKGVLMRASGFWATVMGLLTIAIIVGAVVLIVWGIFFTN